ncbi:MAG: preprotein translocase subunit SecD, partial [Psychroserpens sp.]
MLNKYPLWKTLMVLLIVAVGALYASPNLYGEDPAVQISGLRGIETNAATLDVVKSHLDEKKISYLSLVMENDQILARFNDTEQQLRARDLLDDNIGDEYSVALN